MLVSLLLTLLRMFSLSAHNYAIRCMLACQIACRVQLFATLWAVAYQAPLSMGFSRQEHWGGLSRPLPRDLPNPGIEPMSLISPALAGMFFTNNATLEQPMQ